MESRQDLLGTFSRLSKLTEIKQKSKDRLKPLLHYSTKLVKHKPAKIFMYALSILHSFGIIMTINLFLGNSERKTFFKYGSFCGIVFAVIMPCVYLLIILDDWVGFLIKYGKAGFPIELMGDERVKKVIRVIGFLKATAIVGVFLAIMTSLGLIFSSGYVNQRLYLCVWIQENFPDLSKWMLMLVYFTILPVALVTVAIPVCCHYGAFTGLFQILFLRCMIADIPRSHIPKKYRRDSELYQEVLRQKMIIAIRTHEYIVGYQTYFSYILESPFLAACIMIMFLAISIMMEFIFNRTQKIEINWQLSAGLVCFAMDVILHGTIFIWSGQLLKDAQNECIYELCQLPWYDMNAKNKKIYSIFLYRSQRKLGVSNKVLELDCSLLLRIVRSIYSFAAILGQIMPPDIEN